MIPYETGTPIADFFDFLNDKLFPCTGAKAALARKNIQCMVAGHMACPADDTRILKFLFDFVNAYRLSDPLLHSAVVIFKSPIEMNESLFEALFWQRLQALSDLDAKLNVYDNRVNADPLSPDFSYSIGGEAFFVVGMHPASSRPARQFKYPALVFNPHLQFEKLKAENRYEKMKAVIRKRDKLFSGSINPMLDDFGLSSETRQYSGRRYDDHWQCPLKINYGKSDDNPAT